MNKYRYPIQDVFSTTGETIDGFFEVSANEQKYKEYSISLINSYVDLIIKYMTELNG
ncbi:MAG: hypothetical protein HRT61_12720 [Ekhidna sp.]|nr:hypothetical protein [Ekhidna sp.]